MLLALCIGAIQEIPTYPPDKLKACVGSANILIIVINQEGCPIKVVVCEEIQPMVGVGVPNVRRVQACAGWRSQASVTVVHLQPLTSKLTRGQQLC
jgi:hypothetical protein